MGFNSGFKGLRVLKEMTNIDSTVMAVLLGHIFFRWIHVVTWALRDLCMCDRWYEQIEQFVTFVHSCFMLS